MQGSISELPWRAVLLLATLAVLDVGTSLRAQQPCTLPQLSMPSPGSNIFNERQEIELGEVLAERLPRYVRVTEDAAVTGYLAKIGERLAKHLPPTQIRFRYFLIDLAIPEAFSGPGGRIYVSRKLISYVRNDDEIAGIIAHEMGHIVTHQGAIDTTTLFREVLGVTSVSDHQDILRKYDALEENWRRNPGAFRRVARAGIDRQLAADQLGLYAVASAGYSPRSYTEIFDRTARTGGRTGTWLSDFFGTTPPDQVRLREMLRSVETMPQACVEHQPGSATADFDKWRDAVYAFSGWTRKAESLHGVIARVKLDPYVRRNVSKLAFSPDGKYILAQKDETIYVLTRNPFAFSFQIHAPDAQRPQFTSDSKCLRFTDGNGALQLWDVLRQERVRIDRSRPVDSCYRSLVSPDATTVACLRSDGMLSLASLPGGSDVFEKESFAKITTRNGISFSWGGPRLGFSPDGRYFLAANGDNVVAFDIWNRQNLRLPSQVKSRLGSGFVFLGSGRLLVMPRIVSVMGVAPMQFGSGPTAWVDSYHQEREQATLFAFPSGEVIDHFPLGMQSAEAPGHGDYLVLRPVRDHAVGVMDLKTKSIFLASKQAALDIYDDVFVHELPDGDIGLYDARSRTLHARLSLPVPPGSAVHLGAFVSPDLKWLAAAQGPIWDLTTGKKLYYLRKFNSGWFEGDRAFFADFPRVEDTPREIARVDLTRDNVVPVQKVENQFARQVGPFLVAGEPQQKTGLSALVSPCNWKHLDYDPLDCNVIDEVSDVRTGKVLWSRRFPKENPRLHIEPDEGRALIVWHASDEGARDEVKNFPQLEARLGALKENKGVAFVEVLDATTGKTLGAQLVDTGGRGLGLESTLGDRLVVLHHGYADLYSLATGNKEGEVFGWPLGYSKPAQLLTVRGDNGNELVIYDLNSLEKLHEFAFSSDIVIDHFSPDGKRLFVLTTDQTAYFLDLSDLASPRSKQ